MLYFNFNLHDSSLFLNLITYLSRDWNVSSVALITASLGSLLSLENSNVGKKASKLRSIYMYPENSIRFYKLLYLFLRFSIKTNRCSVRIPFENTMEFAVRSTPLLWSYILSESGENFSARTRVHFFACRYTAAGHCLERH